MSGARARLHAGTDQRHDDAREPIRDPRTRALPARSLDTVSMITALPAFLGAWAAVATSFRRGSSIERHQIKWLLAVALVGVGRVPGCGRGPAPGARFSCSTPAPGSSASSRSSRCRSTIGVAILRYRLYEIDRLISRTIGWAMVTGMLVAVFAGLVVALQAVLAPVTDENTLAVAASTLVAFALFQPLRRRVQRAVDRRSTGPGTTASRRSTAFAEPAAGPG